MNKKRILLVDDDRDYVRVLGLNLEAHEYQVSAAYSGREALQKAQKEIPHLILLDITLPDLNGYEVCQRLRQDDTTHDIPIIILTGRETPQEKIKGLYLGADDFLTKPFDIEELLARIESLLRRSQTFEEKEIDKLRAINEIKEIINKETIKTKFQPIVSLKTHKLLGMEVLSRPSGKSYFQNPESLFDTAFHLGMLFELEMACHKNALKKLGSRVEESLAFFNISPYLIENEKFKKFISFYTEYTKPNNIVLELTERTAIRDFAAFFNILKSFKKQGFRFAIDDLGSGYASLNSIVEIKPDFIKIDMHIIRNIDTDKVRQNLLKAIIAFCKKSGFSSIAEGIESEKERRTLVKFGVDYGQGYLFGKPTAKI